MKKWLLPAKTFLVGEYAALLGHNAILLTTSPCFELLLVETPGLHGIHPQSPAGLYWQQFGCASYGLRWCDPYHGIGGLGASTAQFLGAYFAVMHLKDQPVVLHDMIACYRQFSWTGEGIRPSGYDVLAQSLAGVVFVDGERHAPEQRSWPFQDIDFILLHTGKKLATHEHLQNTSLDLKMDIFAQVIHKAEQAFTNVNSQALIEAVNAYHHALYKRGLVAVHSMEMIMRLRERDDVLAVKGCGALGADILLLIVPAKTATLTLAQLETEKWHVIASNNDLFSKNA